MYTVHVPDHGYIHPLAQDIHPYMNAKLHVSDKDLATQCASGRNAWWASISQRRYVATARKSNETNKYRNININDRIAWDDVKNDDEGREDGGGSYE